MEENQELLLNQIIDLHGKVVYTYTTHHKIQNRLERINKGVKISQIILTAVSTVSKYEVVKFFQTASLHRNDKQIILKAGGGRNGKRR